MSGATLPRRLTSPSSPTAFDLYYVLTEMKNVGAQSYTQQLRDFGSYARANNLRFDLCVRRCRRRALAPGHRLVYCSLIAGCHQVYALERAWQWTSALSRWCDGQPQLVTFSATCQVHRAQLLQMSGAWG
jgi:Restriction endonuclease fold toxin 7